MSDDERRDTHDRTRDDRSPEEIRRDIQATRDRLTRDLDELGTRLSPAGLRREAVHALSGAQEAALDATRGMASRIGLGTDRAGSSLLDRLGEHPLPTALLGAGVGWLLMQASDRAAEDRSAHLASGARGARSRVEDNALPIGVAVALAGLALGAWWTRRRADRPAAEPRPAPARALLPSEQETAVVGAAPPPRAPYDFVADLRHYEEHHDLHHGTDEAFSAVEPAYRFGAELGTETRLSDRSWDEVEDEARRRWEREGTGAWSGRRSAIRYGFERARLAQDPLTAPAERLP